MSARSFDTSLARIKPMQQRSRLKIESILDATARLLASQGLESVTMLAIADQAALPPATVYHYFESRLAIFASLVERTMAQVDAELEQHISRLASSSERFSSAALLLQMYAAYRQAPGYVYVLQVLNAEPSLRNIIRASNQRIADVMAAMLVQKASISPERAARVAWIISESSEQVLQKALSAQDHEANALMQELIEVVDVLFQHYVKN